MRKLAIWLFSLVPFWAYASPINDDVWQYALNGDIEKSYEVILDHHCENISEEMLCFFLLTYVHYREKVVQGKIVEDELIIPMYEGIDGMLEHHLRCRASE